jgi:hypothetical protein
VKEMSDLYLDDISFECDRLVAEEKEYKASLGDKVWQESMISWQAHKEILASKEIQVFLIAGQK